MSNFEINRSGNGHSALVVEDWESACYVEEAENESCAFTVWAQNACGAGPWKTIGEWLFARTCHPKCASRVFGPESSLLVLLVQAWASRVNMSAHLATGSEMGYAEQCVFLMVRALRYVAPDAVRKGMRDDA